MCCESYKKSLQLDIEAVSDIAYTGVGICPGFPLRKWEENTCCSLVRFNFCANILWASCEWETKHDDVKKKKKIIKKPQPKHTPPTRKRTLIFCQSTSHFWYFPGAHI